MSLTAAPRDLRKVQDFVNTWDEESQVEELTDPQDLKRFFEENGLWRGGRDPRAADLRHAIEVREALRALMCHNHGEPLEATALQVINSSAVAARLELSFTAGAASLDPKADGVTGAIGSLLTIVATAMSDGSWERVKICQNDDCAVAFYDSARNRSAKWCSMAVCGNRMKARTYRERHDGARA